MSTSAGLVDGALPPARAKSSSITAAITVGTAIATKISLFVHSNWISAPPRTGPTIEPKRPMPRLQPTPVERSVVG